MSYSLLGSCVRQDGKSASLTAPNGAAQTSLLKAALEDAGVPSREVAAVEAHGTGTALGDPIEMRSMKGAVLKDRGPSDRAVMVGSIKANCGHAEAAAGASGLLRLAVGVATAHAPPNAQLRVMNEHVLRRSLAPRACFRRSSRRSRGSRSAATRTSAA